jgi:xanthosine utilization system XapX-like protein
MLVGEQVLPVGQRLLAGCDLPAAWREAACTAHLFGALPGRATGAEVKTPRMASEN